MPTASPSATASPTIAGPGEARGRRSAAMRSGLDDEHRAVDVAQHALGDAAEEQALQGAQAAGTHDDEVHARPRRGADDLVHRVADEHLALHALDAAELPGS